MKKNLDQVLKNHLTWLIQEGLVSGTIAADGIAEKADLRRVDLRKSNLSCADLRESNLYGADLRGVDLSCADLRRVDLRKSNLSCADLRRADLSCADLRGADLRGVDLRGTDLSGANLFLAENIVCIGPVPTSRRMIYIVNGPDVMIRAGCFWGNVDELEKAVRESHNDSLYLAICEMIRGGKMFRQ